MPSLPYGSTSVPLEKVKKLLLKGGYSAIYPVEQPLVPLAGNWTERYCCLNDTFKPILSRLQSFEVRENDVWIVTSPKCGTTWMQELAWLVINNFDFNTAKNVELEVRSPFIEFNGLFPDTNIDTIDEACKLNSPRFIKSHLPAWLLPPQIWTKKAKIIYVFRDPKDAVVSFYHHWCGLTGYEGKKEQFMQSFIDGYIPYSPFWPHALDFWQLRNDPQIFFSSYERMKTDLCSVIKGVCTFLNKSINDTQMLQLVDHLSFDKMKNNSKCNHAKEFECVRAAAGVEQKNFSFVRRGIVGSHKDEMPKEVVEQFDVWTRQNLKPYNIDIKDITNYTKY